jgi:hypothetical protein
MPTERDMSEPVFPDIEARLRAALAPVDPPEHLQARLELTLDSLVELAADELEAWELGAMRDPRNWPRAVLTPAAIVVGTGAAAGLVILRTRRRRPQSHGMARTMRIAAREARRVFEDLAPDR